MSSQKLCLAPGDIVHERYRIHKIIGRGGMSTVYLAEDLRLAGKRWAIKESWIAHALTQHFKHEAHLLAQLDHPNLPQIVDYFVGANEACVYVVMDYIEGETLQSIFEKSAYSLPWTEIVRYMLPVCDLLHYLHTQEPSPIIYRDLKPSNIMVDARGQVTLIDFGIARQFKIGHQQDTVQIGSTGFAAPELFENKQTDHRSDLFSLGAMLFYLLSQGKLIYVTRQHLTDMELDLPSGLIEIVEKATRIDPEQRYADAISVKEKLRLCLPVKERDQADQAGQTNQVSSFPESEVRKVKLLGNVEHLLHYFVAQSAEQNAEEGPLLPQSNPIRASSSIFSMYGWLMIILIISIVLFYVFIIS